MELGTPVWWGRLLLFCVRQSVKTKETNPTRPGSATPCKQAPSRLRRLIVKIIPAAENFEDNLLAKSIILQARKRFIFIL